MAEGMVRVQVAEGRTLHLAGGTRGFMAGDVLWLAADRAAALAADGHVVVQAAPPGAPEAAAAAEPAGKAKAGGA